jgi:large subunit ribosomal protein L25
MEQISLAAKPRTIKGTRAIKRLRAEGKVPAVVYGREFGDPLPLEIEAKDLRAALSGHSVNAVIQLHIDGRRPLPVMVHERQFDVLSKHVIHLDLHAINLREEVEAEVALVSVGSAPGVKEGGVIDFVMREVAVKALPADIPEQIEVDVSVLQIGDTIHVRDIAAPANVKIVENPDEIVLTLLPPPKVEEVAPPAEEVPAEPELVGAEAPVEEEIPEE